jgi:beta-lactamase class A
MAHADLHMPMTRRELLHLMAGGAAAGLLSGLTTPAAAARHVSLEHQVNAHIQSLRRSGSVSPDERTAWSVYDFTAGRKLVSINEDRPLQAASMIKPFLAQAYFFQHQQDARRYPYDHVVRRRMEDMIRESDNDAANFFINRVGRDHPVHQRPQEVERVLKRHAGGIFRQVSIVEFIPHNGRSYRNRASAHDYSRFLYAMCRDRLPFVREIKHYMGLSNRDRIQDGTADVPRSVSLYHKTGTTAHLCGDMGLVEARDHRGKAHRYTFVGIIQKVGRAKDYGAWMRERGDVIRGVSDLVYLFMRRRLDLAG